MARRGDFDVAIHKIQRYRYIGTSPETRTNPKPNATNQNTDSASLSQRAHQPRVFTQRQHAHERLLRTREGADVRTTNLQAYMCTYSTVIEYFRLHVAMYTGERAALSSCIFRASRRPSRRIWAVSVVVLRSLGEWIVGLLAR